MKKLIITTFGFLASLLSYGQSVSTSICKWKNDAVGAYNFIHDDYGDMGVIGINNYADTMAYNRGLKFTFGAIANSCENNSGMYAQAIAMMGRGHEMISHSHTHKCAHWADWDPCDITSQNWGDNNQFGVEIDQAHQSIINNTGHTPVFYIYPYDRFTASSNNHLKSKNYIGSRTGEYEGVEYGNFAPDADGFFRTALIVDADASEAHNLNYYVDRAINDGVWVNREMHNVGPTGWGTIPLNKYRDHLNYLKTKVDAGQLWVGTISEILTYQIQKINYTPTGTYNGLSDEIVISWNNPSFNVAGYLAPLTFKSPVSIKVNVSSLSDLSGLTITQNGNSISDYKLNGNSLIVNAYPHEGNIIIKNQVVSCPSICISDQPQNAIVNHGSNVTLSVIANSNQAINYTWYKNNSPIANSNSATLTLSSVQEANNGEYYVVLSNALGSVTSNSATVSVQSQTPYLGSPIAIPGKLEAEHFDVGGQNVSFYESNLNSNQGGHNLRTEMVDIEQQTNGIVNISYIQAGEWLEYTVNIANTAPYNLTFNKACVANGKRISLFLDGVKVADKLTFNSTNGWANFQQTTHNGVFLEAGIHVLRIYFEDTDFNLDYITFVEDIVNDVQNNANSTSSFAVYPNPTRSQFFLQSNLNHQPIHFTVSDLNGNTLEEGNVSALENTAFGENLESGMYILQINTGGKIESTKIIKQ